MMKETSPSGTSNAQKNVRETKLTNNGFRWGHPVVWKDLFNRGSFLLGRWGRTSPLLRVRAPQLVEMKRLVHQGLLSRVGKMVMFSHHLWFEDK
jgi:hypothetical protein